MSICTPQSAMRIVFGRCLVFTSCALPACAWRKVADIGLCTRGTANLLFWFESERTYDAEEVQHSVCGQGHDSTRIGLAEQIRIGP